MTDQKRPNAYLTLSLVVLLGIAGCGSKSHGTVAGHVTKGGQPLDDGLVTFRPQPQTQGPEFSGKIAQGEYRVAIPVLPGDYLVDVRSWKKTGRVVKSPFGTDTEEIVQAIPNEYHGPKTRLRASIVVGDNQLPFDLP